MRADFTDRLAKLLLMLGSDVDGEVVNAARMLVRTLASEDMDLHDLAAALKLAPGRIAPDNMDPTAPWAYGPRPESPSEAWGLTCERGYMRPWKSLAFELLKLNHKIPKRYGGKCLMPHQVLILQRMQQGGRPTIAEAHAIRLMDNLLRTAQRAQEADQRKAA
ncbi:hypothetical protein MMSR116_05820 [Methylobacterium mesophilicum SR1.6/6]|uniref:Uncharacterized protein n=1 Tax=Methylobacterium mesophilicum SR1.6/6 TaxID=908290 RepID=A0A6B9FEF5_9HYPH|nr:hypothetical protein [Methylobacterium mesophilicum]QGY01471.1 hypothetical protein MMSR116_05820 [Methylobacterium mesophilicum SR1.6/6]